MAREEDVPPRLFRSLMQERPASGRKISYTLSREGSWDAEDPSHYVATQPHRAPPPTSSLEPSMVHRFSSAPNAPSQLDEGIYSAPRHTPVHDRNSRDLRSFGKIDYQHEPQSEIAYAREQRYVSLPSKPIIQRGVSDYGIDRSYQPMDSGRFSDGQLDRTDRLDRVSISYKTPPRTPTSYTGAVDRGSYGRQISGPPSVSYYENFRSVSGEISKDRRHHNTHVGFGTIALYGSMVDRQHFFHRSMPDMVDQPPSPAYDPTDPRSRFATASDVYRFDEPRRPEAGVREVRSMGEAEMAGPGGYPRRTSTGSPRRSSTMASSASAMSPHVTHDYPPPPNAPIDSPRGLLGNRHSQSGSRAPYVSRSGHDEISAGVVTPPYSRHAIVSSYTGGSENWRNERTERADRDFASKPVGGYGQQRFEAGMVDGLDRRGSGYTEDMNDEVLRHQRLVEQVTGQNVGRLMESPTRKPDYGPPPLEPRSPPITKVLRPPSAMDLASTSGEGGTAHAGASPLRPMTPPTPLTRSATPPTPSPRTASPLQRPPLDTDRTLEQKCREGNCQAALYRQMTEEKERKLKELKERETVHQEAISQLRDQVVDRDSALQEWQTFAEDHLAGQQALENGKVVFEAAQAEELSRRLQQMSLLLEKGQAMMFPWEVPDPQKPRLEPQIPSSAEDILSQSEALETHIWTLLARAKTMDSSPIECPVQ